MLLEEHLAGRRWSHPCFRVYEGQLLDLVSAVHSQQLSVYFSPYSLSLLLTYLPYTYFFTLTTFHLARPPFTIAWCPPDHFSPVFEACFLTHVHVHPFTSSWVHLRSAGPLSAFVCPCSGPPLRASGHVWLHMVQPSVPFEHTATCAAPISQRPSTHTHTPTYSELFCASPYGWARQSPQRGYSHASTGLSYFPSSDTLARVVGCCCWSLCWPAVLPSWYLLFRLPLALYRHLTSTAPCIHTSFCPQSPYLTPTWTCSSPLLPLLTLHQSWGLPCV